MSSAEKRRTIQTGIGDIHIRELGTRGDMPVVILYGVYLDSRLYAEVIGAVTNLRIYLVDMPLHGESTAVREDWTLADCENMTASERMLKVQGI